MSDQEHAKRLAKLGALRAAFAAALPERLEAIAACWRTAETADTWGDAHAELARLTHTMAGSAGTFGYYRLGEKAREIDKALALLSKESDLPLSSQITRIAELLGTMYSLALAEPDDGWEASNKLTPVGTNNKMMPDNRRIVLIEDDTFMAQEIAMQLCMFGWEVNVFANAIDAVNALTEPCPAAVIIDLMLPEGPLAGLELMQQVQSHENMTVPHVVISNRNDWESRLAAVRSGAAAYLVKPVDISALEEQLDRITNHCTQEPYRVLLVDDDEMLADHYAQILAVAGMNAIAVTRPSLLLDAMGEHQPEIVLMDLYMPECSGVEVLKVIRQDIQYQSLPVVFLSSESGLALQQNAMQTGAEDFLQKPISDANLIMAVSIRAERFRALTRLIRQDSLTGLLNHIAFKLRLEAEVDRSRRSNAPLSLAMLDIDHFKKVNDTYGHPQGDRVIKSLAQLLRKRLRKSDIIGRYGGEEFVIAMPNTQPSLAIMILNELRESFGKLSFETTQGEFACTFSSGVAAIPPIEGSVSLIHFADDALYNAKRSGRNRIELFIKADRPAP